jgi:uncharacterized protein
MKPVVLRNLGDGAFSPFSPVPRPIGALITEVRTASGNVPDSENVKMGIWEATPGKWHRVITRREFSFFISGHCRFTPEGSDESIEINAGDSVYFAENSLGIWDIIEPIRKAFIIFD